MKHPIKFRLTIAGKSFTASMADIQPIRDIADQCPFEAQFVRSANHEYYARLPGRINAGGIKGISKIQKNRLYLFAAWNAFSLNFADMDISPYEVIELGTFDEDIVPLLKDSADTLTIKVKSE